MRVTEIQQRASVTTPIAQPLGNRRSLAERCDRFANVAAVQRQIPANVQSFGLTGLIARRGGQPLGSLRRVASFCGGAEVELNASDRVQPCTRQIWVETAIDALCVEELPESVVHPPERVIGLTHLETRKRLVDAIVGFDPFTQRGVISLQQLARRIGAPVDIQGLGCRERTPPFDAGGILRPAASQRVDSDRVGPGRRRLVDRTDAE